MGMNRPTFRTAAALLGLLCIAAPTGVCAQAPVADLITLGPGVAKNAEMDAIYARFRAAYRNLDIDAAADLYTDDALYLAPDSEIARGKPAIRKIFENFFGAVKQRGGKLDITFNIVDRKSAGGLIYDVGIYTLKTTGNAGEVNTFPGKFVVVARKSPDGLWRFQLDTYNNLVPNKKG
jgi:uncharacterized protein (TIGR02246 family)